MARHRVTTLENEEGEEIRLPLKWEICPICRGNGKSSAYLGAFTSDDMAEDPDFAIAYMDGEYDRTCDECGGAGKIQVVAYAALDEKTRERYDRELDQLSYDRELEEMERRFGC